MASVVLSFLKATFEWSAPLVALINYVLTTPGTILLTVVGGFLIETFYRHENSGPRTASQQSSWYKAPAFLPWTADAQISGA
jgi:hypothetical protein